MRSFMVVLLCLLDMMLAYSQGSGNDNRIRRVDEIVLEVSDVKWVYLKFGASVKYADLGTEDIMVEVTKNKSIVRVKSVIPDFEKTTVTVISMDGKIHTLSLVYNQDPKVLAAKVSRADSLREEDVILPLEIELSDMKTSHLILPDKVLDFAVGCDSIIADKAEETDNIVKCRAVGAFEAFEETSMTVITNDGNIYPFIVKYNRNPKILNFSVGEDKNAMFTTISANESEMSELGEEVLNKGVMKNNLGVVESRMAFYISSVFICGDVLMFNISVDNLSKIDYEIDFIKCYVTNRQTAKAQAFQIDEKIPLYAYSRSKREVIPAKESYSIVFFYRRFTIPDKHDLYFEIFEKNGGRHMKFTIPNKELLKAKHIVRK